MEPVGDDKISLLTLHHTRRCLQVTQVSLRTRQISSFFSSNNSIIDMTPHGLAWSLLRVKSHLHALPQRGPRGPRFGYLIFYISLSLEFGSSGTYVFVYVTFLHDFFRRHLLGLCWFSWSWLYMLVPLITFGHPRTLIYFLSFEDIGKLSWIKSVVEEEKNITKFIYNHT